MFGNQGLEELRRRKQELIATGAQKRARLARECRQLEPALSWVDTLSRLARQAAPVFSAAAPLIGGWWAKSHLGGGLVTKLRQATGLFRGIRSFYRGFMRK
ncbi:MAG: hypothetical protein JNN07_09940 [Verrucomicrobiales bacterium]|nr:hypothetical protein [Verrucomicrobiales bacterium]